MSKNQKEINEQILKTLEAVDERINTLEKMIDLVVERQDIQSQRIDLEVEQRKWHESKDSS